MLARAMPASPLPACVKNSRREETFQWCFNLSIMQAFLIYIQELIRVQQGMTKVHEGRSTRRVHTWRHHGRHRRFFVARQPFCMECSLLAKEIQNGGTFVRVGHARKSE